MLVRLAEDKFYVVSYPEQEPRTGTLNPEAAQSEASSLNLSGAV